MDGPLMVVWVLGSTAVFAIGFLIGRLSVLDLYVEAVAGNEVIARFDRRSAVWLRRQAINPTTGHLHTPTTTSVVVWRWPVKPRRCLSAALRTIQPLAPLPTRGAMRALLRFLPPTARTS